MSYDDWDEFLVSSKSILGVTLFFGFLLTLPLITDILAVFATNSNIISTQNIVFLVFSSNIKIKIFLFSLAIAYFGFLSYQILNPRFDSLDTETEKTKSGLPKLFLLFTNIFSLYLPVAIFLEFGKPVLSLVVGIILWTVIALAEVFSALLEEFAGLGDLNVTAFRMTVSLISIILLFSNLGYLKEIVSIIFVLNIVRTISNASKARRALILNTWREKTDYNSLEDLKERFTGNYNSVTEDMVPLTLIGFALLLSLSYLENFSIFTSLFILFSLLYIMAGLAILNTSVEGPATIATQKKRIEDALLIKTEDAMIAVKKDVNYAIPEDKIEYIEKKFNDLD